MGFPSPLLTVPIVRRLRSLLVLASAAAGWPSPPCPLWTVHSGHRFLALPLPSLPAPPVNNANHLPPLSSLPSTASSSTTQHPTSPPNAAFHSHWLFFSLPTMPQATPIPVNYSSSDISSTVRPLLTTIFFYKPIASMQSVTGKTAKMLIQSSPLPTSVASLQHIIWMNNFSHHLVCGGQHLDVDRIFKGVVPVHTCQPVQHLLPAILLAHSSWTLQIDQFNGDNPVECGCWFLYHQSSSNS